MTKTEAAVDGILALFSRYDIHATWATVGLLGNVGLTDLKSEKNSLPIPYTIKRYSPFPITSEKHGSIDPNLLLGRTEIMSILNQTNQELASHTYSHLYCCEDGISAVDFELDCKRMTDLGQELNHAFTSIVFPRNQVSETALDTLNQEKYTAYRGNQENKHWKNSRFENESFYKKMMRVLDAYFKISKTKTYKIADLAKLEGLLNIPANRFFRPHSGKRWMEIRKIKRVKREMLHAAQNETVYHLWWHPHNFNTHLHESIEQIEELLAYQLLLKEKYGFESLNMSEIAAYAKS
ncbi:MAG: hypothetical protein GQ574_20850 [Crocinitomix sp.]|nr:hypothetical protein [Crocinitomix sp.]